jgi:hypothetical protein
MLGSYIKNINLKKQRVTKMKKSILRFLGYITYTIFIGFVYLQGIKYAGNLEKIVASQTYNPFPLLLFKMIFPIVLGILMALPHFFELCATKVAWRYDWVKFISIGIPTFFVTILPLVYFYTPGLVGYLYLLFGEFIHSLLIPQTFGGIVFGYVLLSSCNKRYS